MLRTGLVTVLLLGLGSTAMASDRARFFVTYDSGGYYNAGHRYDDCRDSRRWSTRDDGYRFDGYRSRRSYPSYGWYSWGFAWDGRRGDHRDWNRRDRWDWDRRDRDHHDRHDRNWYHDRWHR